MFIFLYMFHLFQVKHNLYLKFIRYRIKNIKNINDVVNIIKNINYFYPKDGVNSITEIIVECFKKYPITELELQKISIMQQYYENHIDINGFSILVLWLSINQNIMEYLL